MIVLRPPGFATLTSVRLYADAAHTGAPSATVTLTRISADVYTADLGAVAHARYYPLLSGTRADGTLASYALGAIDVPVDDRLAVSPETLARRAGISLPLDDDAREVLTEAILDAQADVDAYLGRPVMPMQYVQTGASSYGTTWDLHVHGDNGDVLGVLALTPEADAAGALTGLYEVVYLAGLNTRDDETLRPIRRYLTAHALNSPEVVRLWQAATGARGEIRSLSAEGQSVSFGPATLGGGGAAGSGAAGSLPTLDSLDRWRIAGRRVHQGTTRAGVWPYSGYAGIGW